MIHRPADARHATRRTGAMLALSLAFGVPTGVGAVPANPPANSEVGGAAAGAAAGAATGAFPLESKPGTEIDGLLRLGGSLTDRGDFATAEIAYWQILRRPGLRVYDQCSALLGLARMYRKENSLTKAAAIYERFLKDHPDEDRVPDALLELGRTLRDMGAYEMAFNAFYNVINSTLKFPAQGFAHYEQLAHTAQFEIAQTHFDAGEYAKAADYFLKVHNLDLAPADKARAQFMSAYSRQLAGQLDAATEAFRAFVDEWPNDPDLPEARYHLATLLRQLKRPQEAMTVTLQLLRGVQQEGAGNPGLWAYWQKRTGNEIANDLFQAGDIVDALQIYQGLVGLSAAAAWTTPVTYQIALCYDRLEQFAKAKAAYQTVIAAGQPGASNPDPELAELAKMASWRLAHLQWEDKTERELTSLFTTGSGDATNAPKPVIPLAPSAKPPT